MLWVFYEQNLHLTLCDMSRGTAAVMKNPLEERPTRRDVAVSYDGDDDGPDLHAASSPMLNLLYRRFPPRLVAAVPRSRTWRTRLFLQEQRQGLATTQLSCATKWNAFTNASSLCAAMIRRSRVSKSLVYYAIFLTLDRWHRFRSTLSKLFLWCFHFLAWMCSTLLLNCERAVAACGWFAAVYVETNGFLR